MCSSRQRVNDEGIDLINHTPQSRDYLKIACRSTFERCTQCGQSSMSRVSTWILERTQSIFAASCESVLDDLVKLQDSSLRALCVSKAFTPLFPVSVGYAFPKGACKEFLRTLRDGNWFGVGWPNSVFLEIGSLVNRSICPERLVVAAESVVAGVSSTVMLP